MTSCLPICHSLQQAQGIENLDDITVLGVILYRGLDPAAKQLSGFFTGSDIFHQLIEDNAVDMHQLLDKLMVAAK